MQKFHQKMDETRAKIQSDLERQGSSMILSDKGDAPWCEICYSAELVPANKPVPKGELGTVEFECKHRFCSECTLE